MGLAELVRFGGAKAAAGDIGMASTAEALTEAGEIMLSPRGRMPWVVADSEA